jgi:hypothetical protein
VDHAMNNQYDKVAIKYHGVRNCSVYDDGDFRKFLSKRLPDSIEIQLRHHCETCDDCAAQLKTVERIVDQEENSELLKIAMNAMDLIDNTK